MVSLFGDWFHLLALLVLLREMGGVCDGIRGYTHIQGRACIACFTTAGAVADRMNHAPYYVGLRRAPRPHSAWNAVDDVVAVTYFIVWPHYSAIRCRQLL